MNILFLDDMPYRRNGAAARFGLSGSIKYATNYTEAVAALSIQVFDVAYLDHDMPTFDGSVEMTGYDVARYIASMPPVTRPRRIVIHSANILGRERMEALLTGIGCETTIDPFDPE